MQKLRCRQASHQLIPEICVAAKPFWNDGMEQEPLMIDDNGKDNNWSQSTSQEDVGANSPLKYLSGPQRMYL